MWIWRQLLNNFKVLTEKKTKTFHPKLYNQQNYPSKNEDILKKKKKKNQLVEFITSRPAVKEMSKEILKAKIKWYQIETQVYRKEWNYQKDMWINIIYSCKLINKARKKHQIYLSSTPFTGLYFHIFSRVYFSPA